MGVRERKQWKKSEGLPATSAATPTNPDPVVMLVVRLLAAASMADDGIAFASRAPPQDDIGTIRRPIRFELVRRHGKWDKQNRSSSGLCPSGVDLPRSEPEAELLPPGTNPTGREYSFSAKTFLGMRFKELAGNNRQTGNHESEALFPRLFGLVNLPVAPCFRENLSFT
jgi:hypothetical protein